MKKQRQAVLSPLKRPFLIVFSCLGLLFESHRDSTSLLNRLVKPWLRVQQSKRNLAGNSSFRKGNLTHRSQDIIAKFFGQYFLRVWGDI